MGFLGKIRRHAAVASGNFASMFRGVEIPPLPTASARLIAEFNRPEPDADRVVKVISATPELAAKVIQTVNSSFYGLRNRVTTVRHAVVLLGLNRIRSIALSYATMSALPEPEDGIFDHEAFWSDSLTRALLARSFARRQGQGEPEEAFTAMLLSDVALPVLLRAWNEYYAPIVESWREEKERLSGVERRELQWDHAQAGAWILQYWGFPDEMVCYVGAHNLAREELEELGLDKTVAVSISVASLAPSALKPDPERAARLVSAATGAFSLSEKSLEGLILEARVDVEELLGIFDLEGSRALDALDRLADAAGAVDAKEVS